MIKYKIKRKVLAVIVAVIVAVIISFSVGTVYGMNHIDYTDPDWKCKKWIGIVELAKQDYTQFVEDTLIMAEKFCGFDVDALTS